MKKTKKQTKKQTKKTKKQTKKKTRKISLKNASLHKYKKLNFIRPKIASKILLGTNETVGQNVSSYHYQKYTNIYNYLTFLIENDKFFKRKLCVFPLYKSLITISESKNDNLKTNIYNPFNVHSDIHKCKKRFIPLSINIYEDNSNHSTILLIDKQKKILEYFDPEYKKMNKYLRIKLKNFQNKFFKNYELLIVTDLTNKTFQDRVDAYSGMCVTWCILYIQYRITNDHIDIKDILNDIHKFVTKDVLLKYGKYISRIIKNK